MCFLYVRCFQFSYFIYAHDRLWYTYIHIIIFIRKCSIAIHVTRVSFCVLCVSLSVSSVFLFTVLMCSPSFLFYIRHEKKNTHFYLWFVCFFNLDVYNFFNFKQKSKNKFDDDKTVRVFEDRRYMIIVCVCVCVNRDVKQLKKKESCVVLFLLSRHNILYIKHEWKHE